MLIKKIVADGIADQDFLAEIKARTGEVNEAVTKVVQEIIEDVKRDGDEAINKYMKEFDGGSPVRWEVSRVEIELAFKQSKPEFRNALLRAKANIEEYHKLQIQEDYKLEKKAV